MTATRSIGTSLTKTSGTPFVVGGLTVIGEIGIERGEIDVTTLDSEDDFKEWMGTFKDAGEMTLEGYIKDETSLANMYNLANSGTLEYWEIEAPSGAKWWFRGFVKMFKEAAVEVEGVRGFTGSIRISGAPVYAANGVSV